MRQEDLLRQLDKMFAESRTEAYGAQLEANHDLARLTPAELQAEYAVLRPLWDAMDLDEFEAVDLDLKAKIARYQVLSQYMRTPQGKTKTQLLRAELERQQREFQPLPEWVGQIVKVVEPFMAIRSACPVVGTIGKVVRQSMIIDEKNHVLEVYPLIWVEFAYPFLTTDHELWVDHTTFNSPELFKAARDAYGEIAVWCGREDESGMTVGFRPEEIERLI